MMDDGYSLGWGHGAVRPVSTTTKVAGELLDCPSSFCDAAQSRGGVLYAVWCIVSIHTGLEGFIYLGTVCEM